MYTSTDLLSLPPTGHESEVGGADVQQLREQGAGVRFFAEAARLRQIILHHY